MDDKTSEQLPAVLAFAQDVSDVSLIDAFIMRMGLAWLLAASLGCGFIGIYAGSARPHRLRIPPAMGEKELARASVSQRAVPLTHAKQRSFALETISASQKTNDPAGRRGREVHGAGDGTRTREYKLGNLFPVPLRATPPCAIETIVPGETDIRTKRTKRAHPQTGRRNADFSRPHPVPIPSFGHLRNPYSFLK